MTKREGAALGLILAGTAAFASIQFRDPFLHCGQGNCGQVGKHAKNFVWHGLARTRGIMLDTSGPRPDLYPRYQDHFYPDHPPLHDLALAGMFARLDLSNRLLVDYADRGRSARLEELLFAPEYDWVVAAKRDDIVANAEFFRGLKRTMSSFEFDRAMRRYGVEELSPAALGLLNRAAVERTESGGFIFFRLRKP